MIAQMNQLNFGFEDSIGYESPLFGRENGLHNGSKSSELQMMQGIVQENQRKILLLEKMNIDLERRLE